MDIAMPRCFTCGSANTSAMLLIGPHGMPTSSSLSIQYTDGFVFVTSDTAALTRARSLLRPCGVFHSGTSSHSGFSAARQNTSQSFGDDAAMLIGLSAVGNTPIGMFTG